MSGYSETVDMEALQNATKALLIIFIIVITIANGALVIKIMRQKHFLYSPKYMLLISLSVGDIFLALFALVIQAKLMFQIHELRYEACRISFYSSVYQNYLINFVYGIGLVVLSAELVYRRKSTRPRTTTHFELLRSFLISSVPWLLGLIIVLPLTMAGIDLNICRFSFTLVRTNAQIVVSMILPACLAVIAAVVVVCFKIDRGYVLNLEMTSGDQTLASGEGTDDVVKPLQQDAVNVPAYNDKPPNYPPLNPPIFQPHNPPYYPPQNPPNYQPHNPPYYPPQNPPNYPPHNPPYPPQGYYPHQDYVNNSSNVNILTVVINDNTPMVSTTNAIYPEQYKILSLALIFFFLVTPFAFYYLVSLNNEQKSSALTKTVFGHGLMWLMLLRPFVTALVISPTGYLTQM